MNGISLRILRRVAKTGEISLQDAIAMAKHVYKNHKDQYPLALLLEEDYLGITINNMSPTGAENMREYSWAVTLHTFSLPIDSNGEVHYLGGVTRSRLDATKIEVFIKAKGLLYLDNRSEKFWGSIFIFLAGIFTAFAGKWLEGIVEHLLK